MIRTWLSFLAAAQLTGGLAIAQPSARPLPRVAIEESLTESDTIVPLTQTGRPLPVPVAARLSASLETDRQPLDERLTQYAARKIPVWLAVPAPATVDAVDRWRAALQSILSKHGEGIEILEVDVDDQDARLAGFCIRIAATDVRSARESTRIALGGRRMAQRSGYEELYAVDVAPYLDMLVVPAGSDLRRAESYLQIVDAGAGLAVTGMDVGTDRNQAVRSMLDAELETIGTGIVVHAWRRSELLEPALASLGPMAGLMSADVTALDPSAANLELSRNGVDVKDGLPHRLLFDARTFATYLVYWSEPSSDSLQLSLTLPLEGVPAVYRLTDGSKTQASDYSRNAENGQARAQVPLPGGPVLVNFSEGAGEVFADRSNVSAERPLTVEEVIARHQQQQRAQDALVRSYIATARMDQHFRPSMTDPGYDVVTENRYYVASDGIEWEELSFSVNGTKWGANRPPFPLLQPEKVLSLPLQLRFDTDYRYRLAGTEKIGNYNCYVVRFEPITEGQSLYRGTVWIDRRTFARVKVQAVQSGLSAPVVSNEEIQTYGPVTSIGNRPIFLFTGLTARQIMMIAGRNLLVEKAVSFRDFHVNTAEFEQARKDARASDRIMYRETDRGLRYYVKDGEKRVVSERATRTARAMAMGVTIDPSYAFPLPIFGINYLNFEFRGPDTQLAILFAGVLAAGNVQRPKIGHSPFDASVDFFAIAVPSSDRLYDADGERKQERLLTWPLTTGANVGWQYTPFQKLSGQYQFRFDGYVRDTTTAESYRVPASTMTNGFGGAWEYRRGGYSVVFNGTWFSRAGWRDWGFGQAPEEAAPSKTYVKYSASVSRDFFFNVFHKIHLNGAWFGGRDLDRFGKYQFGMFDDTRIHGVPSSGVRFEELAAARGAYSFNIFDQYRLDLFLEHAWGRDRVFDDRWQPITGLGTAINLRAPWNTMLRADFGKSFLPDRYRGIGSATLQIMILKPLR